MVKYFANEEIISFYFKRDINNKILSKLLNSYEKLTTFNLNKYFKTKSYYYKNYEKLFNGNNKTEIEQNRKVLEYLMYLYNYNIGKINHFMNEFKQGHGQLIFNFNELHLINFDIILNNSQEFLSNNFLTIINTILENFNNDYNMINLFFDKYREVSNLPDTHILTKKEILEISNEILLLGLNIDDKEMAESLLYNARSGIVNESNNKVLILTRKSEELVETISENLEDNKDKEYKHLMPFIIEKPTKVNKDYYMYMNVPVFDKLIYGLGYATNSCMTLDGVSADILKSCSENEDKWSSYIGFKLNPQYKKDINSQELQESLKELNKLIEQYNKELILNDNNLKHNKELLELRDKITKIVKKYFIINSFAITWIKGNQATYDNFQGNNNANVETDNINYHVEHLYKFADISTKYNYLQILKELLKDKKEGKEFNKNILKDHPLFVTLGTGYTNKVLVKKLNKVYKGNFNKFTFFDDDIYTDARNQIVVNIHSEYNIKEPAKSIEHFKKIYSKNVKDIEKLIDKINNDILNSFDNNINKNKDKDKNKIKEDINK